VRDTQAGHQALQPQDDLRIGQLREFALQFADVFPELLLRDELGEILVSGRKFAG
jgi:hypothetical protein